MREKKVPEKHALKMRVKVRFGLLHADESAHEPSLGMLLSDALEKEREIHNIRRTKARSADFEVITQ